MPRWIKQSLENRFYSKVAVTKDEDCWLWLAGHHERGYGLFYAGKDIPENTRKGSVVFAHKVALYIQDGIWNTLCVCHTCDNPACVNPKHLFRATHKENMKDMALKQRNYLAKQKLTPTQAKLIREADSSITNRKLAAQFGISESHCSRVRSGRCSQHREA